MRKRTALLLGFILAAVGLPAHAETCWNEIVPAATLLLPYFEVDFTKPSGAGVTTVLSINNAKKEAALAQVTLWTDWAQPTLAFNVYLTGFDVQTINLHDVFSRYIPVTADRGTDPADTTSPQGPISDDSSFPGCNAILPYPQGPIASSAFDFARNGHTGQPISFIGNRCLGAAHGDAIARGYATIDSVSSCALTFPSDPGYFVDGGAGVANNNNVLWGDYFIIDPAENFSFGDNLAHIEAKTDFDASSSPTGATFYGRYTHPGGFDNREPLGTIWGARFLNGGGFDGGTDLIVWRDTTSNDQPTNGFACDQAPSFFPLYQQHVYAFDEAEDVVELCYRPIVVDPAPEPEHKPCFKYASGRYALGEGLLDLPHDFGWIYLDLNLLPDAPTGDVDFGTLEGVDIAQSFVTSTHSARGVFQVGLQAMQLASACENVSAALGFGIEPFP